MLKRLLPYLHSLNSCKALNTTYSSISHTINNPSRLKGVSSKPILDGGELYLWKYNQILNVKPTHVKLLNPDGVEQTNKITKVVNGPNSIMAILTTDGYLYTQGSGKFGALGHNNCKDYEFPRMVEFFAKKNLKVIDVVCGNSFMMALTSDGDVWTWGWGGKQYGRIASFFFHSYGALGQGNQKHLYLPQPVQELRKFPKIKNISCGSHSAFALNESNQFFYWGNSQKGCFGDGYTNDLLIPRMSRYFEMLKQSENTSVSSFKSCNHFTVAQLTNGELVSWGYDNYWQLGILNEVGNHHRDAQIYPYPEYVHKKIFGKSKIVDYQISDDILLIRLENNQIFFCGMKLANIPKEFKLPADAAPIKLMGAIHRYFAVVDTNNRIYMMNKFMEPNLGHDKRTNVYLADNSIFGNGDILSIGGTYQQCYAIVRK